MVARDWLKSLFKASYKGVPFWVETDEETGGRRIVEHQFPMRDLPYLEDLGEDLRRFTVNGYVASDRADDEASALTAICATRGAGTLVLPLHGPVFVRCLDFERERSKDRHGYLAIKMRFSREGAAKAVASVASLANLIFVAADNLAVAAASSFGNGIRRDGLPDYVAEAATDAFRDAVASLETARTSEPVAPAASAEQRDEIQSLFDNAADLLATSASSVTAGSRVVAVARALGDALPAEAAVRAFEAGFADFDMPSVPPYASGGAMVSAENVRLGAQLARMSSLTAYCEAVARISLTDRPMAITLRANVTQYIEAELEDLSAADADLYRELTAIRDAVIGYLSLSILDLAPIVIVGANQRMPSLFWGWRLYKDPSRSLQLVERNRVAHPSFMPTEFEALAK